MNLHADLQPDQNPSTWDLHVADYEVVFEPLTDDFVRQALAPLGSLAGRRLLDVAAGAGGAALMTAAAGAEVTTIEASRAMAARIAGRAAAAGLSVRSLIGDAAALDLPDAAFDVALSSFGIVLLPDPLPALREMARVVAPGGRLAVITWTEPEHYELSARLRAAIEAVGVPGRGGSLPAQLRYVDPAVFAALFAKAGLARPEIVRLEGRLEAKSAAALAGSIGFAPGMAALLAGLGEDRDEVVAAFEAALVADQGSGPVSLRAVAHVAHVCNEPLG